MMKRSIVFILVLFAFVACKKVEEDPSSYGFTLISATLIPDGGAGGLRFRVTGYYDGPEEITFDSIGVVALQNSGDWEFYTGNYQYDKINQSIAPGVFVQDIQLTLGSSLNNLAIFAKSGNVRLKTKAVPISDIFKRGNFLESAYFKFDGNINDNNGKFNLTLNTIFPSYVAGVSPSANANDLAFSFDDGIKALSSDALGNLLSGTSGRTFSFRLQYSQPGTVFYLGDNITSRIKVSVNVVGGLIMDVGSSTYTFGSALNVGVGNWNHVIIQMPQSALESDIVVYVNGIPQTATPLAGTASVYTATFQPMWIGAGFNGNSASPDMQIDDFRVWNFWVPKPYVNLIAFRD